MGHCSGRFFFPLVNYIFSSLASRVLFVLVSVSYSTVATVRLRAGTVTVKQEGVVVPIPTTHSSLLLVLLLLSTTHYLLQKNISKYYYNRPYYCYYTPPPPC